VPFELQIALRYLFAKRKQALISVISLISTLGVTVGVMAVIVALAIMTGLQQEVQNRILGANSHIYVWKRGGIPDYKAEAERLGKVPHVLGAAPAILGPALVIASGTQEPIQLKGIDPEIEPKVTDIAAAIKTGSIVDLDPAGPDNMSGILLGVDLASKLGVKVGDTVKVQTLEGTLSPLGLVPNTKSMRVAGTFALLLAIAGLAAALWQHFVAAKSASCNLTLADRVMSASQLDRLLPDVFEARASCADAAVNLLGIPYAMWSALAFVVAAIVLIRILRRSG